MSLPESRELLIPSCLNDLNPKQQFQAMWPHLRSLISVHFEARRQRPLLFHLFWLSNYWNVPLQDEPCLLSVPDYKDCLTQCTRLVRQAIPQTAEGRAALLNQLHALAFSVDSRGYAAAIELEKRQLAWAMLGHSRLGGGGEGCALNPELIEMVGRYVSDGWWGEQTK